MFAGLLVIMIWLVVEPDLSPYRKAHRMRWSRQS